MGLRFLGKCDQGHQKAPGAPECWAWRDEWRYAAHDWLYSFNRVGRTGPSIARGTSERVKNGNGTLLSQQCMDQWLSIVQKTWPSGALCCHWHGPVKLHKWSQDHCMRLFSSNMSLLGAFTSQSVELLSETKILAHCSILWVNWH